MSKFCDWKMWVPPRVGLILEIVSLGQIRVKLKREKNMWVKLCIILVTIKRGGGEVGDWGQCQPYFLSLIRVKHS